MNMICLTSKPIEDSIRSQCMSKTNTVYLHIGFTIINMVISIHARKFQEQTTICFENIKIESNVWVSTQIINTENKKEHDK
jgi:hypothetical protein